MVFFRREKNPVKPDVVIGDKAKNDQNADSSCLINFGVKSYLHQFYEPATKPGSVQRDDFEFVIEPNKPRRIRCSKCVFRCVTAFIILVPLALSGTGIFFIGRWMFPPVLLIDPAVQEAHFKDLMTGLGIIGISISIMLSWIWCFQDVVVCIDDEDEGSVTDSENVMTTTAKGQNSNYVKSIPVTEEIRAVQYDIVN